MAKRKQTDELDTNEYDIDDPRMKGHQDTDETENDDA